MARWHGSTHQARDAERAVARYRSRAMKNVEISSRAWSAPRTSGRSRSSSPPPGTGRRARASTSPSATSNGGSGARAGRRPGRAGSRSGRSAASPGGGGSRRAHSSTGWSGRPERPRAVQDPRRDPRLARRASAGDGHAGRASGPGSRFAGADGWSESATLARGWTPTDEVLTQYVQRLDLELDPPRVPDGYVLRTLRGPEDIPPRVDVHRAAFAPSRMTIEKYEMPSASRTTRSSATSSSRRPTGRSPRSRWAGWIRSAGSASSSPSEPIPITSGAGWAGWYAPRPPAMREAGLRDALVFSLRTNTASEALYRSAGFEQVALHRT